MYRIVIVSYNFLRYRQILYRWAWESISYRIVTNHPIYTPNMHTLLWSTSVVHLHDERYEQNTSQWWWVKNTMDRAGKGPYIWQATGRDSMLMVVRKHICCWSWKSFLKCLQSGDGCVVCLSPTASRRDECGKISLMCHSLSYYNSRLHSVRIQIQCHSDAVTFGVYFTARISWHMSPLNK